MDKVSVGVIGTGHLGRFHALNYAQIPGVELVGVTDSDPEKAGKVAQEARCRVFANMDDMLAQVDAVSVAVPTDRHYGIVSEIFKAKKHCLVEKPVTATLDEADRLVRMAENAKRVFHVGHIERFNPALQALQGMRLNPRFIEAHRLAPFNPRGTEVAVILDLMIHDIDIVLSLADSPIENLDASGVAVVSDSIDIANARLKFKNGLTANLTASRISQKKMRKMRLFQKDAYISVDFDAKFSEIYALDDSGPEPDMILGEIGIGERKRRIVYRKPETGEMNALQTELKAFLNAVRHEPSTGVTGSQGRNALAVALDILKNLEA
ncbi:Gfo/Idh/MocA family oxidoreductase [bacterium]|nr:Gfo/Idh/MocA family oxidoreductase [bacterium]